MRRLLPVLLLAGCAELPAWVEQAVDAGPRDGGGGGEDAGCVPAPESCNGRDDDCDGRTDEGFDLDRDGWTSCGGDCDDGDPFAWPGAPEVCGDGVIQDCGGADEPCPDGDLDGDGHVAEEAGGDDCDDLDAGSFPGAPEHCGDHIDQDCDGADSACLPGDADRDGSAALAAGGGDCNDEDARVRPGAPDACGDGIDQDCDGVDPGCATDMDGDGYLLGLGDCDDEDAGRKPWTFDLCNGIDDDCDGLVDEGNPLSLVGEAGPPEVCYEGPPGTADVGICVSGDSVCTRGGTGRARVECVGQVLPATEECGDDVDGDCSGDPDDAAGAGAHCTVRDGLGPCADGRWACQGAVLVCRPLVGASADLACDGVDTDCDGVPDERETGASWHRRACFDGPGLADVGICSSGEQICQGDEYGLCLGQVPAGAETCDNLGVDNDCDGVTNDVDHLGEACATGLTGVCGEGVRGCEGDELRCLQQVFARGETCDGEDNDCDGETDEGFTPGAEVCLSLVDEDCDGETDEAACAACEPDADESRGEGFANNDESSRAGHTADWFDACALRDGHQTSLSGRVDPDGQEDWYLAGASPGAEPCELDPVLEISTPTGLGDLHLCAWWANGDASDPAVECSEGRVSVLGNINLDRFDNARGCCDTIVGGAPGLVQLGGNLLAGEMLFYVKASGDPTCVEYEVRYRF